MDISINTELDVPTGSATIMTFTCSLQFSALIVTWYNLLFEGQNFQPSV